MKCRIAHCLFLFVYAVKFIVSVFIWPIMLFVIRINLLLLFLFLCIFSRCFAGTPPRGTRKEVNRALNTGVRSLSFDSDDDDDTSRHEPARVHRLFSDDEDEGHGPSSSGTSSGASRQSFGYRRPNQPPLSASESDDQSSINRGEISATSGVCN
jgi:hypothetical protein